MKKTITPPFAGIAFVSFCLLLSLTGNAQRREERHRPFTHPNREQHFNQPPTRTNGNRGPERHPPIRYNNSQPPTRITDGRGHNFGHPNRDFRTDVSRRGRYNQHWYHYNNRPPAYSAHNPSWRYRSLPRRNTVINVFPFSYQTINYGGCGYRYYNGTFYRPYNSSFIVVAPPVGLFIHVLPFGYRNIYVNNNPYYYYNGTYYDKYEDNYRVVAPPVGAVVESLPQGYETITVDGETYYKVDGVQYKPVVQDNGEIWYEVIKID